MRYDLNGNSDAVLAGTEVSLRSGRQPRFGWRRTWQRTSPWRRVGPWQRSTIRRGTSRDRCDILILDGQSFDEFWRFGGDGLDDSMTATPTSRLGIIRRADLADPPEADNPSNEIVGYALAGRAGRTGYLQRLAVHPAVRQRGIGTLLINDALAWARRRGAELVWVNTQQHNENALRLYQKIGFDLQKHPLSVMYRSLT